METRKVTIINSKTQSQKVIQDSKATTLGELKHEMSENNIDYEDMTFFEGHMRAELKDDASPLPTNIPYKGQVVNDLIFMLTTPEKKVKSGSMSRAEVYTEIKKRGLQSVCVDTFGKNFTQCSTADLNSLIEGIACTSSNNDNTLEVPNTSVISNNNYSKALTTLAFALYDEDVIGEDTYETILNILNGDNSYDEPKKMSKADIDEMFSFVER